MEGLGASSGGPKRLSRGRRSRFCGSETRGCIPHVLQHLQYISKGLKNLKVKMPGKMLKNTWECVQWEKWRESTEIRQRKKDGEKGSNRAEGGREGGESRETTNLAGRNGTDLNHDHLTVAGYRFTD